MDLLEALGQTLSAPGDYLRGGLAGKVGERASGHDLLRELGLDPGDGIGGTLAGIGTDIATDPLTYTGGYLAKRLLAGGFGTRSVGMGEKLGSDVYDLAAGHNFETGALNPRVVHYPEYIGNPIDDWLSGVPAEHRALAESAAREAGGGGDWLGRGPIRMADEGWDEGTAAGHDLIPPPHGGEIPLPLLDTSPLDKLPLPIDYGHGIGYGEHPQHGYLSYDPGVVGLPADLGQDGRVADALRVRMLGWNDAALDMGRLTPEARLQLEGGHVQAPTSATDREFEDLVGIPPPEVTPQWVPPSLVGVAWQNAMRHHLGDLQAIQSLAPAVTADAADLIPQAAEQYKRLFPFLEGARAPASPASGAARDITSGAARPRDIRGMLPGGEEGQWLAQLPLDETRLRRMAAMGQFQSGENILSRELMNLEGDYRSHADHAIGDPGRFLVDANDILTGRVFGGEIEPNIVRQLLEGRVSHAPLADTLATVRDLVPEARQVLVREEAARAAAREAAAARPAIMDSYAEINAAMPAWDYWSLQSGSYDQILRQLIGRDPESLGPELRQVYEAIHRNPGMVDRLLGPEF